MEKCEKKFCNKSNHVQNDLMNYKNIKSKSDAFTKFDFSRNSFLKNKNRTSINFTLHRNLMLPGQSFKDISNKKEELLRCENDSNRKTLLVNTVKFDINFLKRISCINDKKKLFSSQTWDVRNYAKTIRWLNLAKFKKKKIDFIKHKFLLGQKNYYKRLFDKEPMGFSSYYSEKINPILKENLKRYYTNLYQLKKLFFENENKNINLPKKRNENLSVSSLKNFINVQNKKNNHSCIKIKKIKTPNIMKQSSNLFIDYKNNIQSRRNYSEDEDHNENNKSKGNQKIIDDIYNDYLKNISSSKSKQSNIETNIVSKKNHKIIIRNIKPLNGKLILKDKSIIDQNLKRQNQNNNSNMLFKNYKNLFKIRKLNSNRIKFLDDNSKSIEKENHTLRKKIMLKQSV